VLRFCRGSGFIFAGSTSTNGYGRKYDMHEESEFFGDDEREG